MSWLLYHISEGVFPQPLNITRKTGKYKHLRLEMKNSNLYVMF